LENLLRIQISVKFKVIFEKDLEYESLLATTTSQPPDGVVLEYLCAWQAETLYPKCLDDLVEILAQARDNKAQVSYS
jgi:hypothetical protein